MKMKKCRSKFVKIMAILTLVLTIGGWTNSFAMSLSPQNLVIDTEKKIIGKIGYEDFVVNVQKIVSEVGVGYCLEIEKDYPTGQSFVNEGTTSERIKRILANGYPNKSAQELGVDSEEEAYIATQFALWSIIEGYDVYKVTGGTPKTLKAIINIYENVQNSNNDPLKFGVDQYYFSDTVQRIAIINMNEVNVAPQGLRMGK